MLSTPLANRKSPQWLLLVLLLLSTLFMAQPRALVQAADSAAELPQGLNLKDIKFTPDPDDITGACQMATRLTPSAFNSLSSRRSTFSR